MQVFCIQVRSSASLLVFFFFLFSGISTLRVELATFYGSRDVQMLQVLKGINSHSASWSTLAALLRKAASYLQLLSRSYKKWLLSKIALPSFQAPLSHNCYISFYLGNRDVGKAAAQSQTLGSPKSVTDETIDLGWSEAMKMKDNM